MSGFWNSPIGQEIKGDAASAFLSDFSVIPDGTTAIATIKAASVVSKEATKYKDADRYIEIIYKLIDGDFKNREVSQKIKVFSGKPEAIHRNLNMLKLVMDLCNFKPSHKNEPTNDDLGSLVGKVVGIKIAEWSMPKDDGTMMEGNFVREVNPSAGFKCETGIKQEVVHSRSSVDSAFSRNANAVPDELGGYSILMCGKLTKIIEDNLPSRPDEKRMYIGASSIGSGCMRQVWYGYNDYPSEPYSPRTLRIFETGKKLEGLVLDLLEDSGVTLTRIYWDLFDGELPYFRGHIDAMWLWTARREPRAIIEVKTAKASMFNQFKNHGLRTWSPLYYAQVQAYMGMSGVRTAYVIVMNKDNCDLWDERVDFDDMYYEELKMRAVSIHSSATPPPKVSNSPGWYICKLCKFRKECHK